MDKEELTTCSTNEVCTEQRKEISEQIAKVAMLAYDLTKGLSDVERTPRHSDGEREDNVQHSFSLIIATRAIAEKFYPNLNLDKIITFATVHDMLELETGDVATFKFSEHEQQEKRRREEEVEHIVLERLSKISLNLASALEEYEKQNCREARFVRAVDKILPIVTDNLGDGSRVMREDYGITDLDTLKANRERQIERIKTMFGEEFPHIIEAAVFLSNEFEGKFCDNQGTASK